MPRFQRLPQGFDFHTGSMLNLPNNSMSDNIRNKAIFEIKICSKSTKIWHFAYLTLTLYNGNVFANTTKKNPVSLSFIVTEIWPGQNKFKKCFFFGQNLNCWQNWILIFRCTTSVGMLFLEVVANFLHRGFLEIWLGQGKRYRQTAGRTYKEGKTIYVSRRGRHNKYFDQFFF